jgi:hypothetical protein
MLAKRGILPRSLSVNSDLNPYERSRTLLSPIHSTFFDLLEKAIDDRYRVLGKVRLTDVVDVRADLSPKQRVAALKRLPPSRLDFIICERDSTFILGAVMIDEDEGTTDSVSVLQESALDKFLVTVGIPVVRLSSKQDYSVEDLRIEVSRALFLKWKNTTSVDEEVVTSKHGGKKSNPQGTCPACGLPYVKRRARKGTYAGKFFLTCSNYPECKQVKLLKDKSA